MNNPQQLDESEFSLKDFYYILRRNILIISIIAIIVLCAAAISTLMTQLEYQSTAIIMVEQPNSSMSVFDLGFDSDKNLLSNEIEILKSRTLAETAVEHLWNSPHRDRLFLFGSKVFQLGGYRKKLRQILSFGFWEPNSARILGDELSDRAKINYANSIRSKMVVVNKRNTNILEITMTGPDPNEVALLVNTMVELYAISDKDWTTGEIVNLKLFIDEQLINTEQELRQVEDSLRSFQEHEEIYEVSGSAQILLTQLTNIEGEYYTTIAELNIALENRNYVTEQLTKEEKILTERLLNSINTRLVALRIEIATNEADLIKNASVYGKEHDIVKSIQDKIDRLKQNLEQQTSEMVNKGISTADPIAFRQELMDNVLRLNASAASFEARIKEYKKLVDNYNSRLNKLPWKTLQLARLERDRSVLTQTYGLLRQKLEEAKITQASQLGKVRTIDIALPIASYTNPNIKMNMLIGLILGISLGVGIAFLLEYLDNTVKSVEDVERKGHTVLGIIPAISSKSFDKKIFKRKGNRSKKRQDYREHHLITYEAPKSPVAEAYRSLRTSLVYSSGNEQIKSILISSPGPAEGKTTTVANLAITYANLGKKTLLVDTDLRRPVLHKVFNINRNPGITHYLSGSIEDFTEVIQETEINNLYVVSAGVIPPNPSELLGSKRMVSLVSKLEENWDMVLFDSPPLVAVTDATMISKEIDRIVMVVKSGGTDRGAFKRTSLALQNVGAPLAGVVLNAVTSKNSYGSYYYYYQYYHYSSDSKT